MRKRVHDGREVTKFVIDRAKCNQFFVFTQCTAYVVFAVMQRKRMVQAQVLFASSHHGHNLINQKVTKRCFLIDDGQACFLLFLVLVGFGKHTFPVAFITCLVNRHF